MKAVFLKRVSEKSKLVSGFSVFFLALLMGALLCGCSVEPVYYSDKEVLGYVSSVYGTGFEYVGKNVYNDDSEEANPVYEYIFKDDKGIQFSVETYTYHVSIDASVTAFYEKGIRDNYIQKQLEYSLPEIEKMMEGFGIEGEIDCEYLNIKLFLEDYKTIGDAAQFLEELDSFMAFEYSFDKWPGRDKNMYAAVYLKPGSDYEDWKTKYACRIDMIDLSKSSEERLEASQLKKHMEWSLAEKAKTDKEQIYTLPQEFLDSYPSGELKLTLVSGSAPSKDLCFKYSFETQSYWIYNLDPCQDYENFSYQYSGRGTFEELVELLGGVYSSDNMLAKWSIGSHEWIASLAVDKSSSYVGFLAQCDGKMLKLSDPDGRSNGTTSGRAFTIEDVEKLLGVEIIENQRERTCQIVFA